MPPPFKTPAEAAAAAIWGRRIIARRKALGITQVQLAASIDVSQQAVSSWEHGRAAPRDETRRRICTALRSRRLFDWPAEVDRVNGDEEAA